MKQFNRIFIVVFLSLLLAMAAWADFCEKCGAYLDDYCPSCGANMEEFCPRCGAKVTGGTFMTPSAPVTKTPSASGTKIAMEPAGFGSELLERLTVEAEMRKEICLDSTKAQSDKHTDKTFTAYGKEWRIGQYNVDWNETQAWIEGLGDGWRTPMHSELRGLQKEVNITSGIGNDWVWAEKKSFSTAWLIFFDNGNEHSNSFDYRYYNYRAVAVR